MSKYQSGNIYHIYNQGNNRQKIFFSEANYRYFLEKSKHLLGSHVDFIAYCLMPNHFHFLVRTKESACLDSKAVRPCPKIELEFLAVAGQNFGLDELAESKAGEAIPTRQQNLSSAIGTLTSSYAKAINKQEGRSGSLFRNKTKAKDGGVEGWHCILGFDDRHFFTPLHAYWQTCFDYIHNNPMVLRGVKNPADYKFSSAREYLFPTENDLVNHKLAVELELVEPTYSRVINLNSKNKDKGLISS